LVDFGQRRKSIANVHLNRRLRRSGKTNRRQSTGSRKSPKGKGLYVDFETLLYRVDGPFGDYSQARAERKPRRENVIDPAASAQKGSRRT
jgi:hypothetical protein